MQYHTVQGQFILSIPAQRDQPRRARVSSPSIKILPEELKTHGYATHLLGKYVTPVQIASFCKEGTLPY